MPLQGGEFKDEILLKKNVTHSKDGPDPEKEDVVMLERTRVSRIFFLRKFFDYPISLKFETFKNMGFKRTMKAGFGYLASCIHKRTENSLEDFYINRFGKPLYQMFFEDYTTKVWGLSPKEISPDWGSQRVKGLSLSKAILSVLKKPFTKNSKKVETSLIEKFYYPKYGPGQLYETMAKKIIEMRGKILFFNLILAPLSLIALVFILIKDIIKKDQYLLVTIALNALFFVNVIAYIIFQISYPLTCTEDFRYMILTLIPGCYSLGRLFTSTKQNKFGLTLRIALVVLIIGFELSSISHYIALI